jgi:hypothetical protein
LDNCAGLGWSGRAIFGVCISISNVNEKMVSKNELGRESGWRAFGISGFALFTMGFL